MCGESMKDRRRRSQCGFVQSSRCTECGGCDEA